MICIILIVLLVIIALAISINNAVNIDTLNATIIESYSEEIEQKELIEVCSEYKPINLTKIIYLTEQSCYTLCCQYIDIPFEFIDADNKTWYSYRETYTFDNADTDYQSVEYLRERCNECLKTTDHIIYNWTEDVCIRSIYTSNGTEDESDFNLGVLLFEE